MECNSCGLPFNERDAGCKVIPGGETRVACPNCGSTDLSEGK